MKSNSVILAVEDDLSYAVSTKMLERFDIEIVGKLPVKENLIFSKKRLNSTEVPQRLVGFLC